MSKQTRWILYLVFLLSLAGLACSSLLGGDEEASDEAALVEPTQTVEREEIVSMPEATPTEPAEEPTEEPVAAATEEPEPTREQQLIFFGPEFRPEEDGFQFRNFGRMRGSRVTIAQLRGLMGDEVCARFDEEDKCKPTATAQILLKMINDLRQEGHCVGFTVASYRLFQDELKAADFSPGAQSTYDIEEEKPILGRIAVDAALQLLPEVNEALVSGAPDEILASLRDQEEPVDLIMRSEDGARHSVMAFGLEENSDGPAYILVYDSNFPGETKRVLLDEAANEWRYSVDGLDSETDSMAWRGDAASESLEFIPLSAYLDQSNSLLDRTIVALTGDTEILIETDEGEIGRWDGEDVNTIPGAVLVDSRGGISSKKGNYLLLPSDSPIRARYRGGDSDSQSESNVRIVSPNMSLSVNGVRLKAGDQVNIRVSPRQRQLSFGGSSKQRPTFTVAYSGSFLGRPKVEGFAQPLLRSARQDEGEAEFMFTFSELTLEAGESFDLLVDEQERLAVSGDGIAGDALRMAMARLDGESEQTYANDDLVIDDESGVALNSGEWSPGSGLEVMVDEDGDGEPESVTSAVDQPLSDLIAQAKSAEQILAITEEYGAYMDEDEIGALLSQLAKNQLAADDYGKILAAFSDAWNLSSEEVLAFVKEAGLESRGLGEFFFHLELSDDEVQGLVDDLDLSDEEADAFWDEYQQQVVVDELLQDWWYLGEDSEYLNSYLVDMQLSGEGYADFFEELYLSEDELFYLFSYLDLSEAELFYLWYELEDEYYYLEDEYYDYYFYEFFDYGTYDDYYDYWYGSY